MLLTCPNLSASQDRNARVQGRPFGAVALSISSTIEIHSGERCGDDGGTGRSREKSQIVEMCVLDGGKGGVRGGVLVLRSLVGRWDQSPGGGQECDSDWAENRRLEKRVLFRQQSCVVQPPQYS